MHVQINYSTGTDNQRKESALTSSKYLSPFQVEKFTYLFNAFFDIEKNGLIEQNDIEAFISKLTSYAGYKEGSASFNRLMDLEKTFFECLQDQVEAEFKAENGPEEDALMSWPDAWKKASLVNTSSMSLNQWLNMWGRLCYGSAGISDFPIWVQILPTIFFDVIDRDQDQVLNFEEIKNFYEKCVGINDPETLNKVSNEGYRVMTANGGYQLNRKNYLFCFANFLLGKSIYGPGKYIFGIFDNREIEETFKVAYEEGQ